MKKVRVNDYTLKLSDILTDENITALAGYVKTSYNAVAGENKGISDQEATIITSLIIDRIMLLMDCYTIYDTIENGFATIKRYVKMYIVALVVETRNSIDSLSKEVGSEHRRSKFNPIDNDDIENAPIAMDEETLQYADAMLTHINFLLANCQTLDKIYSLLRADCITLIA